MTTTEVIIKKKIIEMWLGMWMTSCPEAMAWGLVGILKKNQLLEIWDWAKRVRIRIWARPVQLFAAGCTRVCRVSELRADAGRTVSIVKIVSLSPRVENLKVKKVIKVSYLNQERRQCFAYFGIHNVYFTYSHHSYITKAGAKILLLKLKNSNHFFPVSSSCFLEG